MPRSCSQGQVSGPRFWRNIPDDDAYRAVVRGYNDWLAEEYCAVDPDRLLGIGVMPWTNVDDDIAEMEHCRELGLRAVLLTGFPNGTAHPLPEDDRFFAAAIAMDMPVTVHVDMDRASERAGKTMLEYATPRDDFRTELVEQTARSGPSRGSGAVTAVRRVLSGLFDRFPSLRVLFAENQIGWIPFFYQSAGACYERHVIWAERLLGFEPLSRLPSEILREHNGIDCFHLDKGTALDPLASAERESET